MFFLLKKYLTPAFYPLSLVVILLLAGLVLLWFTRRQKAGKVIMTIGVAVLMMFSYGPVPDRLLKSLEGMYPPYSLEKTSATTPPVKWVIVLGGGHTSDPGLPLTDQISTTSLARLVEGIRIYRQSPGSRLILSGGAIFDPEPEAKTLAKAAMLMNIDPKDIRIESRSTDTEEQARQIGPMVGKDRFALVTSAFHMHRSMVVFRKAGLNPVAAPAARMVKKPQGGGFNPGVLYPSPGGLYKTGVALHEYLGLGWTWLKGCLS